MVHIVFPEGRTLSREGEPGTHCYRIVSGRIEASVARPGVIRRNARAVVTVRGPGDLIGEVSVLLGSPRSTTLTAIENTTCEVFTKSELMAFLERHPQLAVACLKDMLERFAENSRRFSISQNGGG